MRKLFQYIFLIDLTLTSLLIIVLIISIAIGLANRYEGSFITNYRDMLQDPIIFVSNMLSLLGSISGVITIIGLRRNKYWVNKGIVFLNSISIIALVGMFLLIKQAEYYHEAFILYLLIGIPMAISSILSFISFIKTKPTKENLPN